MKSAPLSLWLLILASLVSCGPLVDGLWFPNVVRARLARGVAQGPGTVIRLDDITPFGYKTVQLFGPYTKVSQLQSWLDVDADEAVRLARGIDRRGDIHLLVFSFEHVPDDSMELPRSQVDFGPELARCSFYSHDAVFVVKEGRILGLAPGITCDE